jgi:hypothetical protein
MALLLGATLTALVLAGALLLAVGVGSAPFLLRRGPASGPAVSTVVGERETERRRRQGEEIDETGSEPEPER